MQRNDYLLGDASYQERLVQECVLKLPKHCRQRELQEDRLYTAVMNKLSEEGRWYMLLHCVKRGYLDRR